MIHGFIHHGAILPLDPIPPDWDGRHVLIEPTSEMADEERTDIHTWYAELEALGPVHYEPGEREAVERVMAESDREAKECVKRSWARFDDLIPPGHEPSQCGPER